MEGLWMNEHQSCNMRASVGPNGRAFRNFLSRITRQDYDPNRKNLKWNDKSKSSPNSKVFQFLSIEVIPLRIRPHALNSQIHHSTQMQYGNENIPQKLNGSKNLRKIFFYEKVGMLFHCQSNSKHATGVDENLCHPTAYPIP
jgi:hypothetical protein